MWALVVLAAVASPISGIASAALAATGSVAAACEEPAAARLHVTRCRCCGTARLCQSPNFVVRTHPGGPAADAVARRCEALRQQLREHLAAQGEWDRWEPRCEVVLHPTRSSYLQAVGPGGAQTVGSSAVRLRGGEVVVRRIDLLAESRGDALSALPHELVHIVLAQLFPDEAPPRWAEEGLALLYDPADKQQRHRDDLRRALQGYGALPMQRLFLEAGSPTSWQRGVFYGQSLSVVEYLTALGTREQFVRFVQGCLESGHDAALRDVYGIDGAADLERRWRAHLAAAHRGAVAARP